MKCGNCKNNHDTAAQVKACYGLPLDIGKVVIRKAEEPIKEQLVLSAQELMREHGVNVARTPVPSALKDDEQGATTSQRSYLLGLANEREWPPAGKTPEEAAIIARIEDVLDGSKFIGFDEASDAIKYLEAKPKKEVDSSQVTGDPFAFPVGIDVPEWGTYTVVLPDGERRTLMFKKVEKGSFKGKTIISYLSGPDNTSNYTGFANATDRRSVRVWKRFKEQSTLVDCLKVLLESEDTKLMAREAWSSKSEKCSKCRRKLTVPASINRGLGPKCAQGGWD